MQHCFAGSSATDCRVSPLQPSTAQPSAFCVCVCVCVSIFLAVSVVWNAPGKAEAGRNSSTPLSLPILNHAIQKN